MTIVKEEKSLVNLRLMTKLTENSHQDSLCLQHSAPSTYYIVPKPSTQDPNPVPKIQTQYPRYKHSTQDPNPVPSTVPNTQYPLLSTQDKVPSNQCPVPTTHCPIPTTQCTIPSAYYPLPRTQVLRWQDHLGQWPQCMGSLFTTPRVVVGGIE